MSQEMREALEHVPSYTVESLSKGLSITDKDGNIPPSSKRMCLISSDLRDQIVAALKPTPPRLDMDHESDASAESSVRSSESQWPLASEMADLAMAIDAHLEVLLTTQRGTLDHEAAESFIRGELWDNKVGIVRALQYLTSDDRRQNPSTLPSRENPPRLDPHTIMACLKEVEVGTPHMIKREVAERIRSLLHSSEQLGDTAATGAECNYYRGPDPKDLPDQFTINMIDIGE